MMWLPGTAAERAAVSNVLAELVAGQDATRTPMTAVHIDRHSRRSALPGISVHHLVADNVSRQIVATDIFTAFRQRLAGQDIAILSRLKIWLVTRKITQAMTEHYSHVGRDEKLAAAGSIVRMVFEKKESGS